MEADGSKKIESFEDEKRRLKQRLTGLSLQNPALIMSSEKALKPAIKRELVSYRKDMFLMSVWSRQDVDRSYQTFVDKVMVSPAYIE